MGFCQECGHNIGAAKFCGECGTKVAAAAPAPASGMAAAKATFQDPHAGQHGGEKLLGGNAKGDGIVGAVRQYTADATQEEKDKKYGQQKWGLFETNYQRNKGITTEQSLQEIEAGFNKFGQSGVTVTQSGSAGSAGSAGSSNSSSNGGGGGTNMPGSSFGGSGSSGSSSTTGGGLNAGKFGSGAGAAPNLKGTASFKPTGSMADQFLQGHLAKEKAKYAPKRNL